jgi:hypothetical protein
MSKPAIHIFQFLEDEGIDPKVVARDGFSHLGYQSFRLLPDGKTRAINPVTNEILYDFHTWSNGGQAARAVKAFWDDALNIGDKK